MAAPGERISLCDVSDNVEDVKRYMIGGELASLDRVWGGGIPAGTLTLLAGPAGIGKSSLTLQVLQTLALQMSVLYISAEESLAAVGRRAKRFGGKFHPRLEILVETELDAILMRIEEPPRPRVVVIDSLAKLLVESERTFEELEPGTARAISVAVDAISHFATREEDIAFVLIGHVTTDGAISGPSTGLRHAVDAMLYFDGKKEETRRSVRAEGKNRNGPTTGPESVAWFDMTANGLEPVRDVVPSEPTVPPGAPDLQVVR